ncbi:MAG: HAMP domain-containing sensor histidine kinase [Chloroflexota bacterium]
MSTPSPSNQVRGNSCSASLAAVESYLQVMKGGFAGETTEKQRNMLARCSERMSGLINLIDDILDISRLDTGERKLEPTSLLSVAENSVENIRPQAAKKGMELVCDLPEQLTEIRAMPFRLQQLLTNLLVNAVKFTPEGGKVTLCVREGEEDLRVEVMDTGVGIPPAEVPRVFDDFYRGSNVEVSGAGLGLAIAKKIVEGHGGRIWAESPYFEEKSGKGSKFTFTLPKVPRSKGQGGAGAVGVGQDVRGG